ncbi:hypothetical protein LIA77_07754 [Sarocladium implicatum]|nr:hypothetical protein LIA77_07754 [Sarocladium implicatum]
MLRGVRMCCCIVRQAVQCRAMQCSALGDSLRASRGADFMWPVTGQHWRTNDAAIQLGAVGQSPIRADAIGPVV